MASAQASQTGDAEGLRERRLRRDSHESGDNAEMEELHQKSAKPYGRTPDGQGQLWTSPLQEQR